jgi:hypothetical protein
MPAIREHTDVVRSTTREAVSPPPGAISGEFMQDEIIKQLLKRIDSLEREIRVLEFEKRQAADLEKNLREQAKHREETLNDRINRAIEEEKLDRARREEERKQRSIPPLEPHPWLPPHGTLMCQDHHEGTARG